MDFQIIVFFFGVYPYVFSRRSILGSIIKGYVGFVNILRNQLAHFKMEPGKTPKTWIRLNKNKIIETNCLRILLI